MARKLIGNNGLHEHFHAPVEVTVADVQYYNINQTTESAESDVRIPMTPIHHTTLARHNTISIIPLAKQTSPTDRERPLYSAWRPHSQTSTCKQNAHWQDVSPRMALFAKPFGTISPTKIYHRLRHWQVSKEVCDDGDEIRATHVRANTVRRKLVDPRSQVRRLKTFQVSHSSIRFNQIMSWESSPIVAVGDNGDGVREI